MTTIWRVSAAWAKQRIRCDASGITEGCGAICCQHGGLYPSSANNGVCFHLGDQGCKLALKDRPTKCLLYPFTIKEAPTPLLVLWIFAITWTCKANRKKEGPCIFEYLKQQLEELFGPEQYRRVYDDVILKDQDSHFEPSQRLLEQLDRELAWERDGKIPEKRSDPLSQT